MHRRVIRLELLVPKLDLETSGSARPWPQKDQGPYRYVLAFPEGLRWHFTDEISKCSFSGYGHLGIGEIVGECLELR